mmetsp:Transcript_124928/g.335311  ORF Transcript_124928/g.335311 Transcript_124928/m.335311 type:complete len:274 (+) Transcript_124928:122-943(+)
MYISSVQSSLFPTLERAVYGLRLETPSDHPAGLRVIVWAKEACGIVPDPRHEHLQVVLVVHASCVESAPHGRPSHGDHVGAVLQGANRGEELRALAETVLGGLRDGAPRTRDLALRHQLDESCWISGGICRPRRCVDDQPHSGSFVEDIAADRKLQRSDVAPQLLTEDRHLADEEVVTIFLAYVLDGRIDHQVRSSCVGRVEPPGNPNQIPLSRQSHMELLAERVGQLRVQGGYDAGSHQLRRLLRVRDLQTTDCGDSSCAEKTPEHVGNAVL